MASCALEAAWLDDACDVVVPGLWVFEVGNILGLKYPGTSAHLLQVMLDLGLREEPHTATSPESSV